MRKVLALMLMATVLLLVGCGVNKDYVAQQIADSEDRTDAQQRDNRAEQIE